MSDMDHGQQAGQVPFSGSREAQPAGRGHRWVGAASLALGLPTATSRTSALDLMCILSCCL